MTTSHPSKPPSLPFPPGTVLVGKYRVERLIGEGGMGWVVEATHLQLEQRVALKFMHASHAAEHPDAVSRFLREARAAARVQSEHVARVADVGTLEDGAPYLVMEYLEGNDLEHLLKTQGALPAPQVIDYMVQACEGLAEAHAAGIVHRDLKPANLFLAQRSDGSVRVKLLDFGISKLVPAHGAKSQGGITSTQTLMGSPLYMSPEQLRSSKNVDRRTDLWSMGVILYEMLSGRSPFDADTLPVVCAMIMAEPPAPLRSVNPDVPAALEAIVMRCLEKDPENRYGDAAMLAEALAAHGGADDRLGAQRVGRVVKASQVSQASQQGGAPRPARSVPSFPPASAGSAKTNAAFTHSSRVPRRSAALPLAIGAGVVGVGAIVFGLISARPKVFGTSPGHAASTVASPATSPGPETPPETSMALPPAPPAVLAPAPAPDPAPTPAPVATAKTTAVAAASTTRPSSMPATKVRPTATTTTNAKPAGTSGFGGRD